MNVACLDFEGVLVPEIWVSLAERTGIEELTVTTRDIPDYDQLMSLRLKIMHDRGLRYADIQAAAGALDPLPGAAEFLNWLRANYQVAIISDTFHELAAPLLAKLGYPMILCHQLKVDAAGHIVGYTLRQTDPKRHSVLAFQALKYKVIATGDSFNDISMLRTADAGMLFQPSEKVTAAHPDLAVARDYSELKSMFAAHL